HKLRLKKIFLQRHQLTTECEPCVYHHHAETIGFPGYLITLDISDAKCRTFVCSASRNYRLFSLKKIGFQITFTNWIFYVFRIM
uniref:Uncharacterized protein n=1 Tax=Ciona savignyi TaxID=51511 RepID=H2Y7D9_CIOSA